MRTSRSPLVLSALALCLFSGMATAREVLINIGRGPQPGADQDNRVAGIDYNFYTWERSARQHIQVGVAYTRLSTNASIHQDLYAVSIYPQLMLYPSGTSKLGTRAPSWAKPYFFARALGPSYISTNRLGARKQHESFAFLAQVGVGVLIEFGEAREANLAVSWKHISNANLFDDNDGIDVPFVLSVGVRF